MSVFSIMMSIPASTHAGLAVTLACVLAGTGCTGDSQDDSTSNGVSDICSEPAQGTMLDGWEVGLMADGKFTALVDEQIVPITYGGQGLPMFGLYVQARGSAVPSCLAQETFVLDPSSMIAGDLRSPLTMHRQDDGTYRSKTAWLILYFGVLPGDLVTVQSAAGQKMFERRVYADMKGPASAPGE